MEGQSLGEGEAIASTTTTHAAASVGAKKKNNVSRRGRRKDKDNVDYVDKDDVKQLHVLVTTQALDPRPTDECRDTPRDVDGPDECRDTPRDVDGPRLAKLRGEGRAGKNSRVLLNIIMIIITIFKGANRGF